MPEHGSRAPRRAALIPGVSAGRTRPDQIRGGNHGLTPEQVASSQRERVLAAMRELVAGRGYQDVSVAEVIRHAGVSRKTFYELWAGKEECFVEVYEREMERLLAPTLQAFEGKEPWADRLKTALGVLLGALAADEDAARICFAEALSAGPLALERRNAAMARLDPLFAPPDDGGAVRAAHSRAATAGAVGYLAELLNRETAAGRAAQLPALRSELVATLTLPFVERDQADAASGRDEPGAQATAESAGERAFLAAYGEIAADLLGRVAAALSVDADPATRLRAGVAALLDYCSSEPDRARACLVEALSAGPAARERRSETNRRLADLLAQPLRELRPSERIAEVSAIALVGGFQELVYDAVDRRAPARLPSVETVVAVARLEPLA
ncbi:MAG TPA: TetR/AcrR family transcriptional regulator [Thermoleophilaceae bacterium]|nr:TetR/AcrR family transcriptional regulator [Thermoleophilaceae bacterium]